MNPKARVSRKPRIISKVANRIRARHVMVTNLTAPAKRFIYGSKSSNAKESLETIQRRARSYTKAVKPTSVLQAKKNVYHNLKKKDIREYKRQKIRQLIAILLDYQVFKLEHSDSQVARFALAVFHKKLDMVDFLHQLTCDIRDLTKAVY